MTKSRGIAHGMRTRGGGNVGIRFSGQWVKFNTLMNTMGPVAIGIASGAQKKFAEKYMNRVKVNIRTGGRKFGYPGHSPKYSKYKGKHGGGSRKLYWGGTMHDSVQVMDLKGGRVGVGIPKGTHRPNYTDESSKGNQLTVSEYANVLEHGSGSRNIKARPVFSDTYRKDMGGNAGLSKYMSWHIARGFRSVGIKLIKI